MKPTICKRCKSENTREVSQLTVSLFLKGCFVMNEYVNHSLKSGSIENRLRSMFPKYSEIDWNETGTYVSCDECGFCQDSNTITTRELAFGRNYTRAVQS